jgi:integrase/recombinase XerC
MKGDALKVISVALPPVVSWWLAPDVLAMLLEEKRSLSTRTAYDGTLSIFSGQCLGWSQVRTMCCVF